MTNKPAQTDGLGYKEPSKGCTAPTVSVIIPCFNQAEFLYESVDSVLAQTYQDFEIIVVNDGSTDVESIRILETFNRPKTSIIHSANRGLASARNLAIEHAKGRYILPLDADDKIGGTYLEKCVAVLEGQCEIGIVYCEAEFFGLMEGRWDLPPYEFPDILVSPRIFCSAMFRKSDWEQAGGYSLEMIHGWEDHDFWLSVIGLGRGVHRIPEVLFYYRQKSASMLSAMTREKYIYSFHKLVEHHEDLYRVNLGELFFLTSDRDQLKAERDQLKIEASRLDYRLVRKLRNLIGTYFPFVYRLLAKILRGIIRYRAWTKSIWVLLSNKQLVFNRSWPKNRPLVSVVIASYNYGSYLRETIDSVLAQTFQDFEIIVIDDGSTDVHTKQVLTSLNTPKTRVIMQTNHGLPVTRNNGIRAARGKYICCLDSDDCLKPTYLEKCLYWLETKAFDVCFSWVQEFGDSHGVWETGPFSIDRLMSLNAVSASAVFKRSLWKKVGGYKKAMTTGYDDWEFWLTLAENGARGHCIPELLFLYRRHARAMSNDMQSRYDQIHAQIKEIHSRLYAGKTNLEKLRKQQDKNYFVLYPFRNILRKSAGGVAYTNGKINILFAVPWFDLGGVAVLKSEVFSRLAKRGVEVTALATDPAQGNYSDAGVKMFEGYRNGNFNLTTFLEKDNLTFIEYLIRSRNIQILFLAGSRFVYESLPLLKQTFPGLKIVDELYNTVGHVADNREFHRYIDINIVASEEVRDCLIQLGETANRIKVIPHGIDLEHFSASNPEYIAYKGARSCEGFTFGFLGRFSAEKRPQDIVQLAAMLPECQFRICGEGFMMNLLQQEIYSKNFTRRVHIEKRFRDALEFYSGIDVLVVPSDVEGLPLVLLEAMALGLPVIATKVGRIPLTITHGENGFLYEPGDMAHLYELASTLIQLPGEQLEKIGENARQTVVQEYNIRKCAESYLSVFVSLLGPRTAS